MKKLLISCLLFLFVSSLVRVGAQTVSGRVPYSHELGLRYSVELLCEPGPDAELEMQKVSVDYAFYGYTGIGFRTGLNLLVPTGINGGFSVPLQFSWRTGRIASAWRRARDEGESYRAQHHPWAEDPWAEPSVGRADPGQSFGSILLSLLPSAFEVHAGFTPGVFFTRYGPSDYVADGLASCVISPRFTCSANVGVRLMIPIWRFGLFGDFTYHCYLTNLFRTSPRSTLRSFMSLGGGLSFNF